MSSRAWTLLVVVCSLVGAGSVAAQDGTGRWSGVIDWEPYIANRLTTGPNTGDLVCPSQSNMNATVGNGVLEAEISHGALIPTGPYAGWFLFWRREVPTSGANKCDGICTQDSSVFWAANPADLTAPVALRYDFSSDVFCSGQSWDKHGQLIVGGGVPSACEGSPYAFFPTQTFRLRPSSLGVPLGPNPPPYPEYPLEFDQGSSAVTEVGTMTMGRYYPTVTTLFNIKSEYSSGFVGTPPTEIRGGVTMVAGGPPGLDFPEGNEIWEVLEPEKSGQTPWLPPLIPVDPTMEDIEYGQSLFSEHWENNSPHYSEEPLNFGDYDLYVRNDPKPDRLFDTYPRMYQMRGGEIFVFGDVNAGKDQAANDPEQAWVLKPDYQDPIQDGWESSFGMVGTGQSGGGAWHDSFYDSGILLQELDEDSPLDPKPRWERILLMGGSRDDGTGNWEVNDELWQFNPAGTGVDPVLNGSWARKIEGNVPLGSWEPLETNPSYPAFQRVFANAVVLPTGELFVVGGTSVDDYAAGAGHSEGATTPVDPIIYDPESPAPQAALQPGKVYEQPNTYLDNGEPAPILPRVYHSVAVLLADGRVLVAGGLRKFTAATPSVPAAVVPGQLGVNGTDPRYSAQVFFPPYADFANTGFGARPVIDEGIPNVVQLSPSGGPPLTFAFDVTHQAGEGRAIDAIVLIRPGAVTHHFDQDQRYVELDFVLDPGTPSGGEVIDTITAYVPAVDEIPPGYYMVFAVETDGTGDIGHRVPSVAKFVQFK